MKDNSIAVDAHSDQSILARYHRAELLEHGGYDESMVLNAHIVPNWIGESDCFWYGRSSRKNHDSAAKISKEYRLVNAKKSINVEAFHHEGLAKVLEEAVNQPVDALSLPIDNLEFDDNHSYITFDAFEQRWHWQFGDGAIKLVEKTAPYPAHWLVSPDETMAAFVKEYNLWVRDIKSGEECALTHDGRPHYEYGTQPESRNLVSGIIGPESPGRPEALWSPDSGQLFTMQMDERPVRSLPSMLYVPQDGTVAPRVCERKYALPGDKHIAQYRMLVIDVTTASETAALYPPIEDSFVTLCPFSGNLAWWSSDGSHTYFVDMTRGQKTARVVSFDTETGATKVLFEESSSTYLDLGVDFESPSMLIPLPETNELLWSSERSGWRHLYLYDLTTGELKKTVTSGDWLVRSALHFESDHRQLWIQLAGRKAGRNPYYRELARVNIDTGDMTILASSDHDYTVFGQPHRGVSGRSDFVVTTQSRVDEAPVIELRDRNGAVMLTVETADITGLPQGWQWPKPVMLEADDGITDIYGVLFLPSNFDPDKKYPVLDIGLSSPFYSNLPTGAFLQNGIDPMANFFYMTYSSLAELGFMVTVIDGRGTPYRSKPFHDFGYGSFMEGGGMVDHVAGIKQLAERYPSMDLDQVGVVALEGPGNGAIFGLLNYPDFYKVGIAYSLWDPRLLKQGEVYCGINDEVAQQQPVWNEAVQNLQGRLLLVAGMLDRFFHSSMTFQLVDALVKANKPVDLLMQPNGSHGGAVKNAHCRAWDYVVRHLQGLEPPKNFRLITGAEQAYPEAMSEKSD